MSVPNEDYIKTYETDGDANFAITFPVQLDASQNAKDIMVYYAEKGGSPVDITSSCTISGKTVITGTAYPETDPVSIVTIVRWPLLIQSSRYKYGKVFNPTQFEKDLDYLMFCLHRLNGEINRTFRAPITDGDIDLVLPNREDRAGHGIAFDATGDNVIPSDSTVANCTPFIETLLDDADAETARETLEVYSTDEIDTDIKALLDQSVKTTDTPEFAGLDLYDGETDADRNISFASDADILWDESEDKFVIGKPINSNVVIRHYKYSIGVWDMNTDASVSINLSGLEGAIGIVGVVIINDAGTTKYPLEKAGDWSYAGSTLTLNRDTSGFFDSTSYEETEAGPSLPYNRGNVLITTYSTIY